MKLRLSSIDPNNNARQFSLLSKYGLNRDKDVSGSIPSMINGVVGGNVPTTRLDTSGVDTPRMDMRLPKMPKPASGGLGLGLGIGGGNGNGIFNKDSFLSSLVKAESGGKNLHPNESGYEGIYQFRFRNANDLGSKIAKQLGVTPEQYRKDVNIQRKFMDKAIEIYKDELTRNKIPVTNYTMWLVHNQGINGAKAIYNGNGMLTSTQRRNLLNQFGEKEKKKLGLSINSSPQEIINAYNNKFKSKFVSSTNNSTVPSIGSNNKYTITPISKKDIGKIHPNFNKFIEDLRKEVKKDKVLSKYITDKDIQIKEGYRSKERQKQLYSIGRTKNGKKVTWTLNSRHNHGIAIDLAQPKSIADMVKKKNYGVESRFLRLAYKLGDKYGIGGIPKRYNDPYHFQLDWNNKLY